MSIGMESGSVTSRVGCIEGTATSRTVAKTLKHAGIMNYAKADAAAELIGKGELDALAMGTEAVEDLSRKLPGSKMLDGLIQSTGVVVVVPKGHVASREWATRFLQDAKSDGTVRHALDSGGSVGAKVAP
jgi:polar amino acid transport system substrate-binding protein